jgi:hypothetical protein
MFGDTPTAIIFDLDSCLVAGSTPARKASRWRSLMRMTVSARHGVRDGPAPPRRGDECGKYLRALPKPG